MPRPRDKYLRSNEENPRCIPHHCPGGGERGIQLIGALYVPFSMRHYITVAELIVT